MTWVFAAFTAVWLAIFIYGFRIDKKIRALREEIVDLESRMK